jgi:hypothetical protein
LELAELSNLPKTIVENARAMATRMRADVEQQRQKHASGGIARQRELCQLAYRLMHLIDRSQSASAEELGKYLAFLQEKIAANQ